METEMNSDQLNQNLYKNVSKREERLICNHQNANRSTDPGVESRVPLSAKFEEEGTQTENSTNEFFYEDPDHDVQEGQTRIEVTDMNRSRIDPESRLHEAESILSSSNRISQPRSHHEGHVPCNLISSSSSHSESDSVIERLSKSVSRLLKPVNAYLY